MKQFPYDYEDAIQNLVRIVDSDKSLFSNKDESNALYCIGVLYDMNGNKRQALNWYNKRHQFVPSSRCLCNMALIGVKSAELQAKQNGYTAIELWQQRFPDPSDVTHIIDFQDPIIDNLINAWCMADVTNHDQKCNVIRKQWKENGEYPLEQRGGILAAYNLGLLFMKICGGKYNDQSLIWFKRAINMIPEAGFVTIKSTDRTSKSKPDLLTIKGYTERDLHNLLAKYANCLYLKLMQMMHEWELTENELESEMFVDNDNWWDLDNLDHDDCMEESQCWIDWNENQESFGFYLMTQCFSAFEIIVPIIIKGECKISCMRDVNVCINNYATFCMMILKDYVQASKYYMIFLERDENNIDGLIGAGIAMYYKKCSKIAIQMWQKAKKLVEKLDEQKVVKIEGMIKRARALLDKMTDRKICK